MATGKGTAPASSGGITFTPRGILALIIAAVSLIFVFSNTGQGTLQFLWMEFQAPVWLMFLLILLAGLLVGFWLGRSRYKA